MSPSEHKRFIAYIGKKDFQATRSTPSRKL